MMIGIFEERSKIGVRHTYPYSFLCTVIDIDPGHILVVKRGLFSQGAVQDAGQPRLFPCSGILMDDALGRGLVD